MNFLGSTRLPKAGYYDSVYCSGGLTNPSRIELVPRKLLLSERKTKLGCFVQDIEYILMRALTGAEDLAASVATRCKSSIVASSAIDLLSFGSEGLINQRHTAFCAEEALFVPMLLLVRKILQRTNRQGQYPFFLEVALVDFIDEPHTVNGIRCNSTTGIALYTLI